MATTLVRRVLQSAGVAAAGIGLAVLPSTAHAAPLNIDYDANGSSTIAGTGSNVNLGPATMHMQLDVANGTIGGDMDLPGTSTRFSLIGFLPVTANVDFITAAPIDGTLRVTVPDNRLVVDSVASYYVKLSNIKVAGFPTFAGSNCRTTDPVQIPAKTPEGGNFGALAGGKLVGEYSIGKFQNCGINTWLINLLIPGDGNTMELDVTNGRLGG